MTDNGWAKVPRSLIDSTAFHDFNMLKVYLYIALRASTADNGLCNAGECCVSWSKMAHDTGMSAKSVRNAVRRLEKNALIGHYERGLKKANVYAIVPIESMQKSLPSPGKEKGKDLGKENQRNFNVFSDIAGKEKGKEKGNRYDNINNGCTPVSTGAPPLEEKESETQQTEFNEYGCEPYYDEFPWRKGR